MWITLSPIIMKGGILIPLPQERIYTTDDIYNLPDGERAELIDGQIYYMAPPTRRHQRIAGSLLTTINNYILSKGVSCEPYIATFTVFLNADDKKTGYKHHLRQIQTHR